MERAGDQDYQLPKELDKFRQSVPLEKTKKGEPPRHAPFTAIDELFDEPLELRDLIMARALSEIRTHSAGKAPARRAGVPTTPAQPAGRRPAKRRRRTAGAGDPSALPGGDDR